MRASGQSPSIFRAQKRNSYLRVKPDSVVMSDPPSSKASKAGKSRDLNINDSSRQCTEANDNSKAAGMQLTINANSFEQLSKTTNVDSPKSKDPKQSVFYKERGAARTQRNKKTKRYCTIQQ